MAIEIEQNPIQVTMIEDSISLDNIRLMTLHLRYPRFIHSELMTHRVFSRNARSSRAVPVKKLLQEPIYMPTFMLNQKGMQSFEPMPVGDLNEAIATWKLMAEFCRTHVEDLQGLKVHKQWANRPLEWFGFIDVLVSSTDWANWNALRDHPAAMPEIQELSRRITTEIDSSIPVVMNHWDDDNPYNHHLPFCSDDDRDAYTITELQKISAARCARISYKPFDSDAPNVEDDLRIFNTLLVDQPLHASPAEHQAFPDSKLEIDLGRGQSVKTWANPAQHGNFYGWRQFRKMLPNEAVLDAHYEEN